MQQTHKKPVVLITGYLGSGKTTLLNNLLRQEKRKVFYYSPLISEKEYSAWATGDLISRLFNGRVQDLVAALVNSDGLTQDDLDELRQMFNMEE